MSTKSVTIGIAAILVIGIAIIAITSMDDHGDSTDSAETDGAFIVEMTPHHEAAVQMAEVATRMAERPETKQLARAIIAAQNEEIDELAAIHTDMFGMPVSQGEHGSLGMDAHMMGMDGDAMMLAGEQPFDRAFIDMMIPHHQGAIRMARVELERGEDERLMRLSEEIIDAQSREIEAMNAWREEWYGSPSPAGGIPAEEEAPDHEMMGH